MTQQDKARILDQLEDSCLRAETGKKDVDLIVALRAVYKLYEEAVRNGKEALPRQ